MKWLENFTLVMRSSITTLREKIEDPEWMLHQLIVDMEEELEAVRAGVAAAIADEIQLRREVDKARGDVERWRERAAAALQRKDESSSRAALEQKVLAGERVRSLEEELERQREQTVRLQESFRELEDKVRQARQRRTLLLARLARAESSRLIRRTLDRAESRSAFAQFSRMERRVERSEALSEAYDRMEGRDPEAEELARRFAADERRAQLQKEFEELKRHVAEEGG